MTKEQQASPHAPKAGFYGKLPAHGDFIQRGLSAAFIEGWDEWLQTVLVGSQQNLQDTWLETYLTSPIWHFYIQPGIAGAEAWVGLLVPSVDSVGRYFPFTIASPVAEQAGSLLAFFDNPGWFLAMEQQALSGLEEQRQAEDIEPHVQVTNPVSPVGILEAEQTPGVLPIVATANGLGACSVLLGSILQAGENSYTLWRTEGSARVPASTRLLLGLPDEQQFTAMMDATWQQGSIS